MACSVHIGIIPLQVLECDSTDNYSSTCTGHYGVKLTNLSMQLQCAPHVIPAAITYSVHASICASGMI